MAIVIESVQQTTNDASSISATKPANIGTGDLIIAHVTRFDIGSTVTPADSWTLVSNLSVSTTAPQSLVYRRIATGSEPSTYDFSFSSSTRNYVSILRITGQDEVSPVSASSGQANSSASTTITAPTLTPTANNLILFFTASSTGFATVSGYTLTTSSPSFTESYDSATGGLGYSMAYGLRPESTATGSATATASISIRSIGQMIAIAPSTAVATGSVFNGINF